MRFGGAAAAWNSLKGSCIDQSETISRLKNRASVQMNQSSDRGRTGLRTSPPTSRSGASSSPVTRAAIGAIRVRSGCQITSVANNPTTDDLPEPPPLVVYPAAGLSDAQIGVDRLRG